LHEDILVIDSRAGSRRDCSGNGREVGWSGAGFFALIGVEGVEAGAGGIIKIGGKRDAEQAALIVAGTEGNTVFNAGDVEQRRRLKDAIGQHINLPRLIDDK
jgi:hypothetical protein